MFELALKLSDKSVFDEAMVNTYLDRFGDEQYQKDEVTTVVLIHLALIARGIQVPCVSYDPCTYALETEDPDAASGTYSLDIVHPDKGNGVVVIEPTETYHNWPHISMDREYSIEFFMDTGFRQSLRGCKWLDEKGIEHVLTTFEKTVSVMVGKCWIH